MEDILFWSKVSSLFQISSVKYWISRWLAWEYDVSTMLTSLW
jgi:hypothetical protein